MSGRPTEHRTGAPSSTAEVWRSGLTTEEAAARLAAGGPNELPAPPEPSVARRALQQAVEPLSLVLLAAMAVSGLVLGRTLEALAIAAIVALNVAIGTVQEHQAAGAVAALRELTTPTARVRRDGRLLVLPLKEVVQGDVVELAEGDRVPADLVLWEAERLAIDEAVLTGESFPAEKHAGVPAQPSTVLADRRTEAFAGTHVVRGRGVGVVSGTGAHTEIGAIATALGKATDPPLVAELRSVAARMSVLAVVLGAALIPILLLRSGGDPDALADAVLTGIALAVAAIPEGMPTVVTSALAFGARRMAGRGAIVRQLTAIEGLGSADVICTDKTGTITTGQLRVGAAVPVPGREDALWRAALRCNDARDGVGDPVDVALHLAAQQRGADADTGADGARVAEQPFDAETRLMVVIHEIAGRPVLSMKGAPEAVLSRCRPGTEVDELRRTAGALARDGMRVLAVADGPSDSLGAGDLRPLGVVAFHDPLRTSARGAITRCQAAGVKVVLVTGDHLATAKAIAARAGIEGPAVEGVELERLAPSERRDRLREAAVVARVAPATKVDLVEAHRSVGRVVAMTGDGVNDAPALNRADVGIAVAGEGGTDVAREAADVVVTNGDLSTIVTAVAEGRRIYTNLRSVVSYLLTGNLSEVLVVALAVLLIPTLAVPLLPVQLLWINLVTDGLPALALGVDRPVRDPLLTPPAARVGGLLGRRRIVLLGRRAIVIAAAVLAAGLLAARWGWSDAAVRTQILLTLLWAHLLLVYAARARHHAFEAGWWRNRRLAAAVAGSLLLQVVVLCTEAGRAALRVAALPPAGWLLAALLALAAVTTMGARALRDDR
jgi:Ca2+-transporting ATPase